MIAALGVVGASAAVQLRQHVGYGCCQSNGDPSPSGRTLPYPELTLGVQGPPVGQCG